MKVGKAHNLTGIILAGGRGTRLARLDLGMPKTLLPFCGQPVLLRVADWLTRHVSKLLIASGQQTEALSTVLKHWSPAILTQDPDVGTGQALILAASEISEGDLIICNGDTLNELDLQRMLSAHNKRGAGATIALTRRQDAQNAGSFVVTRDQQVLRSFEDEQPRGKSSSFTAWNGASMGVLIVPSSVLMDKRLEDAISLEREIIPHIIDTIELFAYDNGNGLCLDIGTPERLAFMKKHEKRLAEILLPTF